MNASKILLLTSLFFLFSISSLHAQTGQLGQSYGPIECGLAAVNPSSTQQNYDVTYCATANDPFDLTRVKQITSTCRRSSGQVANENFNTCDCHDDDWYKFDLSNPLEINSWIQSLGSLGARGVCNAADKNLLTGPPDARKDTVVFPDTQYPTLQDPVSGKYYTCWTIQQLNRDVGIIETQIQDQSGNKVCELPRTNVTPCNYGAIANPSNPFFTGDGTCSKTLFEYFDNVLETRVGVGIPEFLYKDPTELGPGDLFCSTITGKYGINTALGCFAFDVQGFTRDFLTLAIGIGGPIGLLLLLYGFFLIATAGPDPAKVQQGQQIISAVVQGLVVIILSVLLLNLFGINILGLPGF